MKIKKIKRKISENYRYLRLLRKLMFRYARVRLTQQKIVTTVGSTEVIELPDLEMWAVYNAKGEILCLHVTELAAANDCIDRFDKEQKLKKKNTLKKK